LPNVGPYIYDVSISGFTRSSIYIYDISSLRVKCAQYHIWFQPSSRSRDYICRRMEGRSDMTKT